VRSAASGTATWASSEDREAVERLLGRPAGADFTVAVRCPHGRPAVIENAPADREGRPFPTRWWLTCRALVEAVGRLEAAGGVRALGADPAMAEPLAAANRRHAALAGAPVAGAGDPRHPKCLHAHLAFALAEGGSAVGDWISARAEATYPERCCLSR
jgi:uncharacterized protein